MKFSPILVAAFARIALAGTFSLSDSYEGEDFINDWNFEAIEDPNHGTVYVVAFSPLRATC